MSIPLINPKPRSNSLSNEVNRTHKTASRVLFFDDYQTNNTVEFEANFKGVNNAVQYKSIADVQMKGEKCGVALGDEARLDFRLQGDSVLRFKLKPTSILSHVDFGQHSYSTTANNQALNFWFNPYVQYQTNRALGNGTLFLGLAANLNNGVFSNNARFKLQTKNNDVVGEFENNWTIRYENFALNWYYSDDLRNFGKNVTRRVTAEYLTDAISVGAELEKHRKSNILDWNLDSLNFGLAYQHNKDLSYGLWSHTNLQNNNATTVAAGMHFRAHRDVTLKAKADTNQDITAFANYNWAKGLNLQLTLQSSIDANRVRDTFNNAFKFGLKLKYDN